VAGAPKDIGHHGSHGAVVFGEEDLAHLRESEGSAAEGAAMIRVRA
jgi:hypothetical protein